MNILKNARSIKQKMMIMNIVSVGGAFAVVGLSLMAIEFAEGRRAIVNELKTQAKIIGSNSSASLSFSDSKSATETLLGLKNSPNVDQAAIYDKDGSLLAKYLKTNVFDMTASASGLKTEAGVEYRFNFGHLDLLQSIVMDNEMIGSIYLRADLTELYLLLLLKAGLGAVLSGFGLALAYFLLSKLQQFITKPIFELISVMVIVSTNKDYSLRVATEGNDELATLGLGFNAMFDQIQKWNAELEYHKQHLEELVTSRTAALIEASKNLERALESEKKFIASISHEMRTPLNAIVGFIDVLVATPQSAEQLQFLTNVQKSSNHLLALINEVLDASKLDAGQMELREGEFCMKAALADCFTIASSRIKEHVKSMIEVVEPPFFVIGDETRVKQVFINMLGNAYKFTERGHVKLALLKYEEIGDGLVKFFVDVEDTGVGIEMEKVGELFTPFKQVHDGKFGGTGMGLFISKALANLMKGDIEVESVLGKGTCFRISMILKKGKIKKAQDSKEDSKNVSPLQPSSVASEKAAQDGFDWCKGLKILLVEDIDMNIMVAEQIFKTFFNLSLEVAHDGLEGVEMASRKAYDLILMDIQMPKMDGITATREIRKLNITTPIVAMTANAFSADVESGKAAGMNDYITKPIKKDLIEKVLKGVLSPMQ